MSKTPTLESLFSSLQKKMIDDANFSKEVIHPTDMGDNTEECWRKWFEKYLPARYKVAKATVIDCRGNISEQIDVVIYDGQYSYLAFNQNGILYLPAESVYAVFEVKQDLTKSHIKYAGEKAESVRKLYRTSAPIRHAGGVYDPKPLHRIIAGILTTETSWKHTFDSPFQKCIMSLSLDQQIDCGCVLEAGAFYFDYAQNNLKYSSRGDSLIFFFLQLLHMLQNIGTVPAIELTQYMKVLSLQELNVKDIED